MANLYVLGLRRPAQSPSCSGSEGRGSDGASAMRGGSGLRQRPPVSSQPGCSPGAGQSAVGVERCLRGVTGGYCGSRLRAGPAGASPGGRPHSADDPPGSRASPRTPHPSPSAVAAHPPAPAGEPTSSPAGPVARSVSSAPCRISAAAALYHPGRARGPRPLWRGASWATTVVGSARLPAAHRRRRHGPRARRTTGPPRRRLAPDSPVAARR